MTAVILVYLLIGCMFSVFLLWITFDRDYDQFVRDLLKEEPPSTTDKLTTALSSVILWPLHLYWIFKND